MNGQLEKCVSLKIVDIYKSYCRATMASIYEEQDQYVVIEDIQNKNQKPELCCRYVTKDELLNHPSQLAVIDIIPSGDLRNMVWQIEREYQLKLSEQLKVYLKHQEPLQQEILMHELQDHSQVQFRGFADLLHMTNPKAKTLYNAQLHHDWLKFVGNFVMYQQRNLVWKSVYDSIERFTAINNRFTETFSGKRWESLLAYWHERLQTQIALSNINENYKIELY